jgi:hypothetical protein
MEPIRPYRAVDLIGGSALAEPPGAIPRSPALARRRINPASIARAPSQLLAIAEPWVIARPPALMSAPQLGASLSSGAL